MDDPRERLLDVLLREELAGEQPPDLAERILQQAFPPLRRRLRIALLAASLLLAIGFLAWSALPTYPAPQASGGWQIVGGGALERGAVFRTDEQPAELVLGGYARLAVAPHTKLRIEGEPHAERIALVTGEVRCAVARARGAFAVATVAGVVSVVGTEFGVRVGDEKGDGKMVEKRVIVSVLAGAVVLAGAWGDAQVFAGEQRVFFADAAKPDAKGGTVIGVVTAKGENFIEVKADGEEKGRRYVPNWVGGQPKDGGGPDKAMMQVIGRTPVGARVKVEWKFEERARVVKLEVLKANGDKK